jgi:hypothetical protein
MVLHAQGDRLAVALNAGDAAHLLALPPPRWGHGWVLLADIRSRHPGVDIRVTPAIGDAPELVSAIAQWALGQHGGA